MKKLYLFHLLFILDMASLRSQDIHLSNYQPASMLFNPATTGLSGADVQFGTQYRSQWAAIPAAYTTMGATAEMRVKSTGFGLQVHQNQAGEASLKTTGILFSAAYHKQLARQGSLSLGLGIGRLQKRFNPALFTWDSQYTEGEGYDATLSNGEFFEKTRTAVTDFTIGLNWKGALSESGKVSGRAGFSLAHIQLPNESFLGEIAELPFKTIAHAGLDFRLDDRFTVSPDIFYQKQGAHREVVGGLNMSASMNAQTRLHLGVGYRLHDALISRAGVDLGNKSIWISYDANVSALQPATGGKGAWELGFYLRFDRNKKKHLKDSDGDGTFDHRDKCPKEPGLPNDQGCPQPDIKKDTDGDGVSDDLDRCPLEPGLPCFYGCNDRDRDGTIDQDDACPELFGPAENNGCPINSKDSDKDGVPDDEDYCVFLKGLPEFHGCPDSDKDGISDIDDECPYIKGARESKGCPAATSMETVLPAILVEFDTDQSFIRPEFRAELSDFAHKVSSHKDYRIMISGHTDAEGNDTYNYELGLKRAREVQDYLSRRGIPFEKMTIISYGEAIPKRSNHSQNGKARNRRAEVTFMRD